MESLTFTDNETKYYGALFSRLDSEGAGVVSANQVHEFLRASKLPPEVLAQVGVPNLDFLCTTRADTRLSAIPSRAETIGVT